MLFFDVDGTVQNSGESEYFDTSVNASEAQIDAFDVTFSESLVSDENVKSVDYNDAMLVLSVLQLFVLIVIAIFTIVRRSNND